MRISTGMIFDAGVNSMNRQTASLLQLQQQVSSGRRILNPSDDPVAAARALEVTQSKSVLEQFSVNHNNATSALGLEEAQLTSSNELMARIRELTVQAGNSSLAGSDRKALAFELRARFDEMLGIANASDGSGQYIFAGFMGATKPFGGSVDDVLNGNEVQYFGDDGQRRLQISPSRYLEVSDSGNDVFKRIRNGNGYFVTDYGRTNNSGAGNTGTGIIDGGRITDPAKWNAAASKSYSINFSVDESVNPAVTYYDIVDTASGNSLFTDAAPVADDFPNMRQFISGQPIMLQGLSIDLGGSVTVEGQPAEGDQFSIGSSSSQSVFATVAKLIGVLEGANVGAAGGAAKLSSDIGFALTNLDQASENILRVRAAIGSRMGEIDSISSVNGELDLQYQQTLSQLQDLDYAKAITDLSRKQTDLQAAQQSFVRVSQLSLFNYL
jgi:flagellar hook-associated protein 3 FlgL